MGCSGSKSDIAGSSDSGAVLNNESKLAENGVKFPPAVHTKEEVSAGKDGSKQGKDAKYPGDPINAMEGNEDVGISIKSQIKPTVSVNTVMLNSLIVEFFCLILFSENLV
jgi:hypothetical protein